MKVDPALVPTLQRVAKRQRDLTERAKTARQDALFQAAIARGEKRPADEHGWNTAADSWMTVMSDAAATHDHIVGLLSDLADA